jgi:hypothetical protein
MSIGVCPPGSHPHSDRPNWRRAETIDEYLTNCREGLEEYSERGMAKLLGMSRIQLWRAKQMVNIPEPLLDRLLAETRRSRRRGISTKALAGVGEWLAGADAVAEIPTCPHCGEPLRVRPRIPRNLARIVDAWMAEQHPPETRP